MIHLATGILVRDERLLLVASRYPNHAQPLWNLPGGRQLPGELLAETVVREVFEETGLRVEADEVAYVSESYDGAMHFLNVTFRIAIVDGGSSFDKLRMTRDPAELCHPERSDTERAQRGEVERSRRTTTDPQSPCHPKRSDTERAQRGEVERSRRTASDHVVGIDWVPLAEIAERITVRVVREPLLAYLRGALTQRYAGFHEADITIEWPPDSQ